MTTQEFTEDEIKVYPIQVVTEKEKIKEYHLRRLYELSLKINRSR